MGPNPATIRVQDTGSVTGLNAKKTRYTSGDRSGDPLGGARPQRSRSTRLSRIRDRHGDQGTGGGPPAYRSWHSVQGAPTHGAGWSPRECLGGSAHRGRGETAATAALPGDRGGRTGTRSSSAAPSFSWACWARRGTRTGMRARQALTIGRYLPILARTYPEHTRARATGGTGPDPA